MIYLKFPFDGQTRTEFKKQVIDPNYEINFGPVEKLDDIITVLKTLLDRDP